jgi:hypothetical protein
MNKNKITTAAVVAVAGILTLTVLAAISSTNQAFAQAIGGKGGTPGLGMPGGTPGKGGPGGNSGSNHAWANGSNNNGDNRNGGSQSVGCSPLDPRGC